MIALACTALVLTTLLYVGWRYERVVRERLDLDRRKLALEEKVARGAAADSVEIPDGLLALAAAESEAWAQEHVKGRMRELYVELGDWNKVGDAIAQELAS